jgi:hypothetical protein
MVKPFGEAGIIAIVIKVRSWAADFGRFEVEMEVITRQAIEWGIHLIIE